MPPAPQIYHFISGLPRAGSTLLAAILRQNPRFQAGMMSPVSTLCDGVLRTCMAGSEMAPLISQAQRRRLVRGIFDAYHADKADKAVVFDTSRQWCARLPMLRDQFPDAKVIACVRNVAWVMDSLERRYRANPYEWTRLFNDEAERNSVYSRVDTLGQRNRLVGFAWTALKEAFYGPHAGMMLVIDYDMLVRAPARVIELLYGFLGEPAFAHDFDHLDYDQPGFDEGMGVPGLHRVRPRVALEERRTVLPPDLFDQYAAMSFWTDTRDSAAHVLRANPTP